MINFKRLSLAKKVVIAPLIGVVLVVALVTIFSIVLNNQRQTLVDVANTEFSTLIELDNIFYQLTHVHNELHVLLIEAKNASDEEGVYVAGKPLLDVLHFIAEEIPQKVPPDSLNDTDRHLYDEVVDSVSLYQSAAVRAIDIASLNWELAKGHMARADRYFVQADRDFHELASHLRRSAYAKLEGNLKKADSALLWFVALAILASTLMVAAALAFSRSLILRSNRVTSAINLLASGQHQHATASLHAHKDQQSIDKALLVLAGKLEELECETRKRRDIETELALAAKVFESANEGIVIADRENNILAVNRAFSEITGFSASEVVGKGAEFFCDRYESYDDVWATLQASGMWQGEIFQRHKNGELRPVWLTSSQVQDSTSGDYHYVSVFLDIAALKDSQARVQYIAQHDALTGLPNRTLFIERLKHAIHRARRDRTRLAVLFVDLDRFKIINDTHGHPLGDELLEEVARRISRAVRADDTVARIGGDEFMLLLEGLTSVEGAKPVAKKILHLLAQPVLLDGKELVVTSSIGIASYPADGNDAMTLIRNADTAMYQAKDSGRDQFYTYTAELTADALRKFALETDLRNALAKNELTVYYQPQTSLHNNEVIGFEALLRWQHPHRGWVSPTVFIPMAEDIGMIEQIGDWVLSEACHQVSRWRRQGVGDFCISVNFSARQLMNLDLVGRVIELLEATGNPANAIEIEVTESAVMEHADRCIAVLKSLNEYGIPVAVDDFGTGYSSLSYLKRLPLQKVKIDRSFVNDLPHDQDDSALVAAIIAMAHSLGLYVVGEGVETVDQLEFLRDHGCDSVQGYYLGRPMPVAEVEAWLEQKEQGRRSRIAS